MKKITQVILGIVVLALFSVNFVNAQNADEILSEAERKRKMIKIAKEGLNDSVWQIELSQMGITNKKREKKKIKDTLRFKNGRIESDKLVLEGFSATNFTVRIKGDGLVIWETMQRNEEEGIAFWRGELREGLMRGVLSWHVTKGKTRDYSFISKKREALPEVIEEEIAPETAQEEAATGEISPQLIQEEAKEPKEIAPVVKDEVKEEEVIQPKEKEQVKEEVVKEAPKDEKQERKKKKKKRRGWFFGR